jgi:eukaryotic-like serine/threonine-protein kinase
MSSPPRSTQVSISFDDAPSATPDYAEGDVIGEKYRLVRLAGEGGMGAVWVAENLALEVPVAIKLIRNEARSRSAGERLLAEARAAAQLSHPAIVRVFDFGVTDLGNPFIVMELLQGETLRDVLERDKRLDAARAVRTMLPIADGLVAAHARGIVHRDLKPDNVLLSFEEGGRVQPKIVDFGVAKRTLSASGPVLTGAGLLVGSPEYMSPEQAQGLVVDHRTDQFAFAVALYELIAGYRPFGGEDFAEILQSIVRDPAEPLGEAEGVDPELWAILSRALAKSPEDRYPSMREMGHALARWAFGQGIREDIAAGSVRASWFDGAPALAAARRRGGVVSPIATTCEAKAVVDPSFEVLSSALRRVARARRPVIATLMAIAGATLSLSLLGASRAPASPPERDRVGVSVPSVVEAETSGRDTVLFESGAPFVAARAAQPSVSRKHPRLSRQPRVDWGF